MEAQVTGWICREMLDAHAQFGGDLTSMQMCHDWYDLRNYCQQLIDIIENYDIKRDIFDEDIALINDIQKMLNHLPALLYKNPPNQRV